MSVVCEAFISFFLFLGTLTMCCMGVAMIYIGATYEDDVSTYLIVGGSFVLILYLLPLLVVSLYIKETISGENFFQKYAAVSFMICPFGIPLLIVPLVCLGILIWGTVIVYGNKSC